MSKPHMSFSRREVLLSSAGLMLGGCLGQSSQGRAKPGRQGFGCRRTQRLCPDWYRRQCDVSVKHLEFGQGRLTGMATLVAEELDADWAQVRERARRPMRSCMETSGLEACRRLAAPRQSPAATTDAGARARLAGDAVVLAAAQSWAVRPEEVSIKKGVISHSPSRRSGHFDSLRPAPAKLPRTAECVAEDPGMFGSDRSRGQRPSASTPGQGQRQREIYHRYHGTGHVDRRRRTTAPFGRQTGKVDTAAALRIKGVVAVSRFPMDMPSTPTACGRPSRDASTDRDLGRECCRKTQQRAMIAEYLDLTKSPGTIVGQKRRCGGRTRRGKRCWWRRAMCFPISPMPPWSRSTGISGGMKTAPSHPIRMPDANARQGAIGKVLGLPPTSRDRDDARGCSFGRAHRRACHFPIELAEVAKGIGPNRPVKPSGRARNDIQGGSYRPLFVHRLRGVIRNARSWRGPTASRASRSYRDAVEAWLKNGIDR